MEKFKILTGMQSGMIFHDLYRSRDNGATWDLFNSSMSEKEVDNHKFLNTPIEEVKNRFVLDKQIQLMKLKQSRGHYSQARSYQENLRNTGSKLFDYDEHRKIVRELDAIDFQIEDLEKI